MASATTKGAISLQRLRQRPALSLHPGAYPGSPRYSGNQPLNRTASPQNGRSAPNARTFLRASKRRAYKPLECPRATRALHRRHPSPSPMSERLSHDAADPRPPAHNASAGRLRRCSGATWGRPNQPRADHIQLPSRRASSNSPNTSPRVLGIVISALSASSRPSQVQRAPVSAYLGSTDRGSPTSLPLSLCATLPCPPFLSMQVVTPSSLSRRRQLQGFPTTVLRHRALSHIAPLPCAAPPLTCLYATLSPPPSAPPACSPMLRTIYPYLPCSAFHAIVLHRPPSPHIPSPHR